MISNIQYTSEPAVSWGAPICHNNYYILGLPTSHWRR